MDRMRSILDPRFRYVPSYATSVAATWCRFGWRPTTDDDRNARPRPDMELVVDWVGAADALLREVSGRARLDRIAFATYQLECTGAQRRARIRERSLMESGPLFEI